MEDDKWMTEKKLKFSMATEKDVPDVIKFLHENFYPDEPVQRNIKVMEGSGWLHT